MDCLLTYKDKTYTHDEFFKYIDENSQEFKAKEAQYQLKGTESSKASPETVKVVKEFLERQGFKIETFKDILDSQGNKIDANAVTNIMSKLVGVVEGKEAASLPEEAMHVVTRILKDKNPELFKEMMNKISSYNLFADVMADYRDNKAYQFEDGKPNVPKLKEEAVGKVLAEYVIKEAENQATEKPELIQRTQTWWGRIKEYLSALFTREHFDPFKKVAKDFLEGATDGPIKGDNEGAFYQQRGNIGKKVFDAIKGESRVIKTTDENGNSRYDAIKDNGEKVKVSKRVTDYSKEIYDKAFRNKELTEKEKTDFEVDRDSGTRLHNYNDDILGRYIDKDNGLRRDKPLDKTLVTTGEEPIYSQLEDYLKSTLDRFPKDTRFIFEQPLYQAGRGPGKGDLAGTIDFLALTPQGTAYNLDWKFMNSVGKSDVSPLTQKVHKTQMGHYGNMLRDYGVKDIRESFTIPIKMVYKDVEGKKILSDITLGDTNYKNIKDNSLVPVPSQQTQVGLEGVENKKLNGFITQLYQLGENLSRETVKGKDWELKNKQINNLNNAIRSLIVKGDITDTITFAKDFIDRKYNRIQSLHILTEEELINLSESEKSSIGMELASYKDMIKVYSDLPSTLLEYLKEIPKEDLHKVKDTVNSISARANHLNKLISDPVTNTGLEQRLADVIGRKVGVYNLLSPEIPIDSIQKGFTSMSSARIKSLQALQPIITGALTKARLIWKDNLNSYTEREKNLSQYLDSSQGREKLNKLLFKYKNNEWTPDLISKFSKDFYNKLDIHQKVGTAASKDAILSIIDREAYTKNYEERLANFIEDANTRVYDPYREFNEEGKKHDNELREKAIEDFKSKYDLDRLSSFSKANAYLKRFPNEEQHSAEYKELSKDPYVLELYNRIHELNYKAHDIGMLGTYWSTFFPQIRKGFVESIAFGGDLKSAWQSVKSGFISEAGDRGYIDPTTGEPQRKISAKYIYDLVDVVKELDGTETRSYKGVSSNIMKVLKLYEGEILKYEALSNIEGHIKLMENVEASKKVLVEEKGKLIKDDLGNYRTSSDNSRHIEYLRKALDYGVYGITTSDKDMGFNFTENGENKFFSVPKALSTIGASLSLKSLGANPLSALSNLFGGFTNSLINTGRFSTKKDHIEGMQKITSGKIWGKEESKLIKLLEHFVPFTEDLSKEIHEKGHVTSWEKFMDPNNLYFMMKASDTAVQGANAHAIFKNSMIEGNNIINIREYARTKFGYDNLYKRGITTEQRNVIIKNIEQEVKTLQDTRNLYNDPNVSFTDKGVVIKGIERGSSAEINLVRKIQQLTRDCLGNRTPEENSQFNMGIFGSAAMQFKNWIPRMVQKRTGKFAYTPGSENYEEGRIRMLGLALTGNITEKLSGLKALLGHATNFGGTDALIEIARKDYQTKIAKQRSIEQVGEGESMFEKTVTEAQYIDNYLVSVKTQIREMAAALSLFTLFATANAHNTQDDDYETKGMWKYTVKALDKFSNELGFFYSPNSAKSLIGQGGLPIFSYLTDLEQFMLHGGKEIWYDVSGDEESAEKNKVMKYPIRNTPLINQASTIMSYIDQDYAKSIGVVPQGDNIINR